MQTKHWILVSLSAVILAACDDGGFACTPLSTTIVASVVDSLANPVAVEAAWLLQDGQRSECEPVPSLARNQVSCTVSKPGTPTLVVAAEGALLEQELDVQLHQYGENNCLLSSAQSPTIVYDGPACDLSQLVAVQGELYVDPERPVPERAARVGIRSSGGGATCTVTGHRFSCPPTSFFATDYTVVAEIGLSSLERSATVEISNCEIEAPAELRIDLSERQSCVSDDRGTISVFLTEPDPDPNRPFSSLNALPDSVRMSDASGWSDCELAPAGAVPAPRPFLCAATTITGGGAYVLEVTRGTRSERIVLSYPDDGCKVISGSTTIRFEKDRVCERVCGPTGELLRISQACSRATPNLSNLPSCPEPTM
jgi:hypothetical protein